ncbi:MAG: sensor domain-containing diguanylate cyclase [Hahellaceae bacterium]|nr:sensor domain-containing diguanylate cyclase [Hahellaceae bacterium]MCP5168946.1 sensor domain-containing diguanylate cyclase [Hahellaceae bacterium]
MLGYPVDSFDNNVLTWENIIHPDDYPRVMDVFEAYIRGATPKYEVEYRCKKRDGDYLWIVDHGNVVERFQDGSVARMIGAHTNVHEQHIAQQTLQQQNKMLLEDNFNLENVIRERTRELEALNRRLERQMEQSRLDANTDTLTKLHNRRKFDEELEKEISRALRYSSAMSLVLIDADFFKKINDNYGHTQGDVTLKKLAQVIQAHIRATDVAARWGGEEFVLILPETKLQQAEAIANKLRMEIESTEIAGQINITCSMGVAQFVPGEHRDQLLKRLDAALYQAKSQGRNCVVCS